VQTFELQFAAPIPALPDKAGNSTNSSMQRLVQYTNSPLPTPNPATISPGYRLLSAIARLLRD
jgi:hypothetical protein